MLRCPQHVVIYCVDILGRYYTRSFFGRMVIFIRPVFYLFGLSFKNLAVQFSIFSAIWFRPTGQFLFLNLQVRKLFFPGPTSLETGNERTYKDGRLKRRTMFALLFDRLLLRMGLLSNPSTSTTSTNLVYFESAYYHGARGVHLIIYLISIEV